MCYYSSYRYYNKVYTIWLTSQFLLKMNCSTVGLWAVYYLPLKISHILISKPDKDITEKKMQANITDE